MKTPLLNRIATLSLQDKIRRSCEADPTQPELLVEDPQNDPLGISSQRTIPDSEVVVKPTRRTFPAEYKRAILQEADACTLPGQLGALLRREGLYASHLTLWRKQNQLAQQEGSAPKRRGRPPKDQDILAPRVAELEREKLRLELRLKQAEFIIDFQKKISELLGIQLENVENGEKS